MDWRSSAVYDDQFADDRKQHAKCFNHRRLFATAVWRANRRAANRGIARRQYHGRRLRDAQRDQRIESHFAGVSAGRRGSIASRLVQRVERNHCHLTIQVQTRLVVGLNHASGRRRFHQRCRLLFFNHNLRQCGVRRQRQVSDINPTRRNDSGGILEGRFWQSGGGDPGMRPMNNCDSESFGVGVVEVTPE